MLSKLKGTFQPRRRGKKNHALAGLSTISAAQEQIAAEPATAAPSSQPAKGADAPPSPAANPPADSAAETNRLDEVKASSNGHAVAVLTLGRAGEILAAREACTAVFGREGSALLGQNVRVLLKGGLANEIGRFLHRHRAGENGADDVPLRVVGLRSDGTEFPASVTTIRFSSDTTLTRKSDASRLSWTVAFRDLAGDVKAPDPAVTSPPQENPTAAELPPTSAESLPALKESQEAQAQMQPQARRLEEELAQLRLKSDELNAKLTAEQTAPAQAKQRNEEPEERLRKAADDLAAVKAEASKRSEGQGRLEFELRAQLDTAKEAAGYAQAALKEEVLRREKLEERLQSLSNSLRLEQIERSKRFEGELIGLRQERDALNNKLAAEQQAAGESTRRAQELESSLSRNATEFERAKVELEKQFAERERSESRWREQLDTAWIMKEKAEGAWAGAVERNKLFEEELAKLRRERDELNGKLQAEQQATAESSERARQVESSLNRNASEFERAKTELEKQSAESERAESEWREQLETAKARKEKLEMALAETLERNQRLAEELADFRQQLETARALAGDRSQPGGEELTNLPRERDALHAKLKAQQQEATESERRVQDLENRLKAEQQAAAESARRAQELENRLARNAAEVEHAQAELDKHSAERERIECRWREQLEAAKTQKQELEVAWAGAVERNVHFEEELAGLRKERDELNAKFKTEQQSGADSKRRAEDLASRLDRKTTEFERARAQLEKQSAERESAESDWNARLDTAKALTKKLEVAWAGAVERNKRAEAELAGLRKERDELQVKLTADHVAAAESRKLAKKLDSRLGETAADLARVKAELEKQNTQRTRSESEWRKQLGTAQTLAKKPEAAPAAEPGPGKRLEEELCKAPQLSVGRYNLKP